MRTKNSICRFYIYIVGSVVYCMIVEKWSGKYSWKEAQRSHNTLSLASQSHCMRKEIGELLPIGIIS